MVEDVSIVLPGNATQSPAIVPVNLMLNFDTEVLANLNVPTPQQVQAMKAKNNANAKQVLKG
jgi:hypothetical protein